MPLRVSFRPAHAGPVVASIQIPTSAGTRSVAFSGYGSEPGLLLSARPLEFGAIQTGAGGKRLQFTFANSWRGVERIRGITVPRGAFRVSGLPAPGSVLGPREAVTASVSSTPRAAGSYASQVRVATDRGSIEIPVSGSAATGHALLAVSPRHIDFGTVRPGRSRTAVLSVSNHGSVPLTITRAIAPLEPFVAPVSFPRASAWIPEPPCTCGSCSPVGAGSRTRHLSDPQQRRPRCDRGGTQRPRRRLTAGSRGGGERAGRWAVQVDRAAPRLASRRGARKPRGLGGVGRLASL